MNNADSTISILWRYNNLLTFLLTQLATECCGTVHARLMPRENVDGHMTFLSYDKHGTFTATSFAPVLSVLICHTIQYPLSFQGNILRMPLEIIITHVSVMSLTTTPRFLANSQQPSLTIEPHLHNQDRKG
jgi:hypothetical protein